MLSGTRPLLFLLLLSVSSSAQPDVENAVTNSAELSALTAFFLEPFEKPMGHSMVLFDAKDRIHSRFGKPISQSSEQYPARTSDERFWSTKLEYSGIDFVVGESEDRTRSWIESILVRSDEHMLKFGLCVGSTREDVISAFAESAYAEYYGQLHFGTTIWEARTDTKHSPGREVTLESAMKLTVDLDEDGKVSRYLIESVEF